VINHSDASLVLSRYHLNIEPVNPSSHYSASILYNQDIPALAWSFNVFPLEDVNAVSELE
jgi:hypothetical protein